MFYTIADPFYNEQKTIVDLDFTSRTRVVIIIVQKIIGSAQFSALIIVREFI